MQKAYEKLRFLIYLDYSNIIIINEVVLYILLLILMLILLLEK